MATKKIKAKGWAETDIVQPDEIITVSWDFFDEMETSEDISSDTTTAEDGDGNDVTSTIIRGTSITTGEGTNDTMVEVILQSLADGGKYKVKIAATITADKVLVSKIKVPCVDH